MVELERGPVVVQLSRSEALVLFEWLWRVIEEEHQDLHEVDQAELRALWNLKAAIERELWEPFNDRYEEFVREARDDLRDTER
jgi:hypothetical protein